MSGTLSIMCDGLEAEDLHLVLSPETSSQMKTLFCHEFKFAHKGFMIG